MKGVDKRTGGQMNRQASEWADGEQADKRESRHLDIQTGEQAER